MSPASWLFLPLTGYLLGSLPWAVWLTRAVAGEDIRAFGSGHAGTTNVFRRLGMGWALVVLLLDVGKGFAAVALARAWGVSPALVGLVGAAAVAGHNWPVFARFRGGMGNATTLGALLAASPQAALVAVGWLVLWVLVWHHAARGTLTAAVTGWALFGALGLGPEPLALALGIGPVLALRFAQDWHRRYRELWLDRPPRTGDAAASFGPTLTAWLGERIRRWGPDLLALAWLSLAAIRLLQNLPQVMDIGLFDETRYLMRGLHLDWPQLPQVYRAPLYAAWYALLARVQPDSLALYDLNLRVQMLALPLLMYGLLRRLQWPRGPALLAAWYVLLSDANLVPWPRASSFAWLVLLAGLGLAARQSSPWARRGVLLAATWLTVYVRPEMLLAVLLLAAEALWVARRARRVGRGPQLRWMLYPAALGLVTVLLLGPPLRDSERLQAAFLQHFAYRWHTDYGVPGGAWSRWQVIGERAFGQTGSLVALVAANPAAFARHLARNAVEALPKAASLAVLHVPVAGPVLDEALAMGLVLAGLSVWAVVRTRGRWPGWRTWGWMGLALAAPGLVSALVIYPRRHYLLGPVLLAGLAWAAWLRAAWPHARRRGPARAVWLWVSVLGLVVVALTPHWSARYPCPDRAPTLVGVALPRYRQWLCTRTATRQALAALRAAAAVQPNAVVAVEADYWEENLAVYLPAGWVRKYPGPNTPEQLLITPADVAIMVYGRRWLDEPEFHAALQTYRARGGTVLCTRGERPWVLALAPEAAPADPPLPRCP